MKFLAIFNTFEQKNVYQAKLAYIDEDYEIHLFILLIT